MAEEKAVTFTGPEQAELLPYECETPGPDGIAGRTICSLISAGTETAVYTGLLGGFPVRPGYAAVFEVEETGEEVEDVKAGEVFFCMGRHQSRQCTGRTEALRVPAGLAPEKAVFARLMGVSWSTLATTKARPPARVLITGLGPVGHLAAQVFRGAGYAVSCTDPTEERRKQAKEAGLSEAAEGIDVEAEKGRYALAVECSGHEAAALDACRVVKKGGEVVLVGVPWKRRTEIYAHEVLTAVFHNYAVLRSGWEWEIPMHERDFAPASIWGDMGGALEWLAEGRVCVKEEHYAKVRPEDCQAAYQEIMKGRVRELATMFDWGSAG
ncbi:MAG: zinc-binding dehydrogenase [Planctomycetes bacterium]|nr:zinc-binding dehydrogenase [Planctomycetota bacterium]